MRPEDRCQEHTGCGEFGAKGCLGDVYVPEFQMPGMISEYQLLGERERRSLSKRLEKYLSLSEWRTRKLCWGWGERGNSEDGDHISGWFQLLSSLSVTESGVLWC